MQPLYHTFAEMTNNKLYRIPDYQRTYSWTGKQRKELFEDIKKIAEVQDINRHHFMATIVVLKTGESRTVGSDKYEILDVVDGQQRLTTLIMLLKAIEIQLRDMLGELPENETTEQKRRELNRELEKIGETLVKSDTDHSILLHTNHDNAFIFQNYLRKSVLPQRENLETIADRNFANGFDECRDFVKRWIAYGKDIFSLLLTIKTRLSFVFYQLEDEGPVYRVFETLNSRGLAVDWLDKCKNVLMGVAFELYPEPTRRERIKELHGVWSNIYREIGLVHIPGDEILRFAATLRYPQRVNRVLSDEESLEFFRKYCLTGDKGSVYEVSDWIREVTVRLRGLYTDKRLSSVTKYAQARLLAVSLMLIPDLNQQDRDDLLSQWERVTFRIYGMCGKDARTKVGDYTRLSYDIAKKYIMSPNKVDSISVRNDLLERLKHLGADFSIDRAIEALTKEDCYHGWGDELRYFLYRYEESLAGRALNDVVWRTIWTDTSYNTIEHVKPQNRLLADLKAGRTEEDHALLVNRLGNLGILPPGINSKAKDKSFAEKKKVYEENGVSGIKLMKEIMDKEKWDEDAIDEREKRLLAWARDTWCDLP